MKHEYKDLSLHAEVRWLSAEKCLRQFFALFEHIMKFLKEESFGNDPIHLMEEDSFKAQLPFLTEIYNLVKFTKSEISRSKAEALLSLCQLLMLSNVNGLF